MPRGRPWRSGELAWLEEQAGRIPVERIARMLGRSTRSVKMAAHRRGLSLRCVRWDLAWCPGCHAWRTSVGPEGVCRVCIVRRQADRAEERFDQALASLSEDQRLRYLARRREGLKERALPPPPPKPAKGVAGDYERRRAERRYLIALERWELACAVRPYNRAKQRLRRLREWMRGETLN